MLIGEYSHSLDTKGRMNFPAKFREGLGGEFYITRWLDDCLVVFDAASLQAISEKLEAQSRVKSREIRRFLYASAVLAEPDKQGRILLPANLREHAHIEKDVVVIGAGSYAEIWGKDAWEKEMQRIKTGPIEEMMEEIDF